ncbi:glycoside hydrolase family 76 [Stylonychia lemnae]|uniref:Glycoside hydrolase family 76 n=1 Tax=Stylonychia lemnae TaxID=5949 RepID=A0A077ZRJ0_STYLE|nr:glycoside hydrolase family 76 [Stylonychia lemnae]|eukprot:CDW71116.1 glycoside hydrolase family 76 [Stylonychia lemnae]
MQTRAFIENKVFNPDELLFSKSLKHRNQWFWANIRGSDDNGWAALALLYAIDIDPAFKDSYLNFTGQYYELGIRQIIEKINEVYRDKNGNIFQLEDRNPYYSMISTTLNIILNQRMYLLTNEAKFLNQSLFDYKFITSRPQLLNDEGLLIDGFNQDLSYFDETVYTYNQGALIIVYGHFYQIYKDLKYLKLGIRHAKNMITYRSNKNLIVIDGDKERQYFMGIYFRFLSEFAEIAYPVYPQEIQGIRDYILINADYLWNHLRSEDNGFPDDYINPKINNALSQNMGIELLTAALAVVDLTY